MPAVMVTADLDHHDNDERAAGLSNLLKAREISSHLDLDLAVGFDLGPDDALEMVVQGEEPDVLAFVSRFLWVLHRTRGAAPIHGSRAARALDEVLAGKYDRPPGDATGTDSPS